MILKKLPLGILICCLASMFSAPQMAHAAIGNPEAMRRTATPQAGGTSLVTDDKGAPLAGVTVVIQQRPDAIMPEALTETTSTASGADGQVQSPPTEVGGSLFVLRKSGYAEQAFPASRPLPPQIRLQKGRDISGSVMDAAGKPIADAVVGPVTISREEEARQRSPLGLSRQMVRTASDGTFTLPNLPTSDLQVQVSAPGFTPRLFPLAESTADVKLQLQSGGAIVTGKVTGSKDRAPQGKIVISARSNGLELSTYTDSTGTYAFDNLPTGTWTLRPAGGGPLSGTQSRAAVIDVTEPNAVKDVPLVLNQGIMIAGRAIDAVTSDPLVGINITLAGYAGNGAKAVLTQPDGSFTFENLDSLQDVMLRFDPVKFVYVLPGGAYRDYFDLESVGDTNYDLTTITLPLHKRLPVKGKVVDQQGNPAPDVEIRLQSLDRMTTTPSKSGPTALEFSAFSNGAGEFLTGIYPAGHYKVWAQQDMMVSQVQKCDVFSTAPMPQLSLRLDRAATLDGLVTDANDQPVTNAVVIAYPADGAEPTERPIPGRETYLFSKSDSTGHFHLKGLRGEPLILRATHPQFVQMVKQPIDPAQVLAASTAATSDSVKLKFPAGGEAAVAVTDDAGTPLSRAVVRFTWHEDLEGKQREVVTDPYGRARLFALPVNQLDKLEVIHPVFAPYQSDGSITLPADLKVSLKKRGSVVVAVKGEPPVPNAPVDIFLLGNTTTGDQEPPASSLEEMSRTNSLAGKAVFANVAPGWYKVAFADGGAYAESQLVHVEAGSGDHNVELTLPKGNHLTGTVVDKATGKGIPGANITLRPAINSEFVSGRAQQNTTTGDEGAFEFYNVGDGTLHARVIANGYPDYDEDVTYSPGQPLKIELSNAPGALSGRVTMAGSPVGGALVVLSSQGAGAAPLASGVSDAQGQYKLDGFPAGQYLLSVEAPVGEGENISRKSIPVKVEDESTRQDVDYKALVAVTGTARLGGKVPPPHADAPVSLLFRGSSQGVESKMVPLDAQGAFKVQLEPGTYIVSLEDREGEPIEIKPGKTQQLSLNFK